VIGYTALQAVAILEQEASAPRDDLVSRIVAGDRDAFVAVYRAHYGDVRAFAQRLLGDAMAADDLVHDVFESLPRSLANFRGDCVLKSYLLAIAVRLAQHHLRAAKRRRNLEERASAEPAAEPRRPDSNVEQRELAALLSQALDALPLKQRAAFVLCEIEERSSNEAALILGEQAGTVRSQVFHAKKKLREQLSELTRAGRRSVPEEREP
jgi:RNA polymerase sigma-70 factor (ECF subfamily)